MKFVIFFLLPVLLTKLTWAETAVPMLSEYLKARDPFRMPSLKKIQEEITNDLEKFSADAFKMIGVVTGPDHLRAVLLAPNGKTYIVAEKMKIGQRGGTIKKIDSNFILFREKIVNIIGEEEFFDTEIRMLDEPAKNVTAGTTVTTGSTGP
ncbi:MAG: pilus assembly protein PilP, partial [Bdellovibrio sp.]|nr:pilus assembly protein PilP [Bdellovibrio sp.]